MIKVHLQMLFTIFLCGGHHIDNLVGLIESNVPALGNSISTMMAKHKKLLHSPNVNSEDKTWLAVLWELVIVAMVSFFLVSMLNSLVRSELGKTSETKEKGRKRPKRKGKNDKKANKKSS